MRQNCFLTGSQISPSEKRVRDEFSAIQGNLDLVLDDKRERGGRESVFQDSLILISQEVGGGGR